MAQGSSPYQKDSLSDSLSDRPIYQRFKLFLIAYLSGGKLSFGYQAVIKLSFCRRRYLFCGMLSYLLFILLSLSRNSIFSFREEPGHFCKSPDLNHLPASLASTTIHHHSPHLPHHDLLCVYKLPSHIRVEVVLIHVHRQTSGNLAEI